MRSLATGAAARNTPCFVPSSKPSTQQQQYSAKQQSGDKRRQPDGSEAGGRGQRLVARATGKQEEEDLDIIESLVSRLFGRKALEDRAPAGMKRLSDEALKELYAAPTDIWAEPLPSDSPDVATLRPLLASTQLESKPLRLAYDAERDGWSSDSFHARVDTFGAAVVVAETAGGAVVGGYNPRGWVGLGEDRDSMAAFLFTWRDGNTSKRPVKLPKVGGAAQAVIRDNPEQGMWFGPDGLAIPLAPGKERLAKCKLGPYYERLAGGGKCLFAEGENPKGTELRSLRVYVAEGEGEQWELDGIVWKTKS